MFKINPRTKQIELTRGDKASIEIKIPIGKNYYLFREGDVITFGIYKSKNLHTTALLLKEVEVTEQTDTVTIDLTTEETKIGGKTSKKVDYWYEVQLNREYTIIGYDSEGAKIITLYPEGSDIK